jgi:hypothetical protein
LHCVMPAFVPGGETSSCRCRCCLRRVRSPLDPLFSRFFSVENQPHRAATSHPRTLAHMLGELFWRVRLTNAPKVPPFVAARPAWYRLAMYRSGFPRARRRCTHHRGRAGRRANARRTPMRARIHATLHTFVRTRTRIRPRARRQTEPLAR